MNTVPFTLHVRLTKACNANCTYCSSYMESPSKYMTLSDYRESLSFIWSKWQSLGIYVSDLTIEYVGGEIMLVPMDVLKSQVEYAREFLESKGIKVNDGAQTNLIGSKSKVSQLNEIFNGKISTSIDSFTDQRRVGDSSSKYKVIMMTRESELTDGEIKKIPAVFTMDKKSIPFTIKEFQSANRSNRNLMIRPVFSGGSSIDSIKPGELKDVMLETLNKWFMRSNIILEPHFSLLEKRVQSILNEDPLFNRSYCSFQFDCARKSMSLEPNGDIHICQELADAGHGLIGNALSNDWDDDAWLIYSNRANNLDQDCLNCPYFKDCQGGCMMHSIQDGNGPYGKPSYCHAWFATFKAIDEKIEATDPKKLLNWIERLKNR